MDLWTFQTPEQVERLKQQGYLNGDIDEYFRPYYEWLMNQLGYTHAPIWFWVEKPLNNDDGFEKHILLHCSVPEERVTVTDIDLWSVILNNSYLAFNEHEWNECKKTTEEEKRSSWERLFLSYELFCSDWFGEPYLQATVETLQLTEVFER
jgi:hypothetical protein